MINKIYRNNVSLRAADDENSREISGYAVVFDSWSRDLGGFIEIIRKGAITDDLLQTSDVIMNINHDDNQMLARYRRGEGTLHLELREDGLYFSFDAPMTERGNEILWNVRNGNLNECSFAFILGEENKSQRWYREDGQLKREITNIGGLFDTSIVTNAAYAETSVTAREKINVDKILRSLDEEEKAAKEAEEKVKREEINSKLNDRLNNFYKNINL